MVMERKRTDASLAQSDRKHMDELLDEALQETFPASDPVSIDVRRHGDGEVRPTKHAERKVRARPSKR